MDSLSFLNNPAKGKLQPVYVLHGDEDFLKRQVLHVLRERMFGPGGSEFGFSVHDGDRAAFAAIHDELATLPFLCARRLVVVDRADPFVTQHRALLEKYVADPSAQGVLVLDVKSWPATTRLAKLVPAAGTITCKAPPVHALADWCSHWCAARHGKQLETAAARLLVDLVGSDMGLLDQEMAKLAVYAGEAPSIEAADVDQLVGSSRAANTFKIFDALAAGRPREALDILDRLFEQGEEPIRMLGAFSMQLRRLAQLSRLTQQGMTFASAAEQVGLPFFARQGSEQQLRHLGRRRCQQLYDWLLEVDLGMKGSSQLRPRTLLERLVVRLARREERGAAG